MVLQGLQKFPWQADTLLCGLPGRREPHVVSAYGTRLREKFGVWGILDDSYEGNHTSRCDLRVPLITKHGGVTRKWVWIEVKTVPLEDATDKLAAVHGDLMKLEEAAKKDPHNLPQAIAVVGYDMVPLKNPNDLPLDVRLRYFGHVHGLDQWPLRLGDGDGVVTFDLPKPKRCETGAKPWYTRCVVAFWGRTSLDSSITDCGGTCHHLRMAKEWAREQG